MRWPQWANQQGRNTCVQGICSDRDVYLAGSYTMDGDMHTTGDGTRGRGMYSDEDYIRGTRGSNQVVLGI